MREKVIAPLHSGAVRQVAGGGLQTSWAGAARLAADFQGGSSGQGAGRPIPCWVEGHPSGNQLRCTWPSGRTANFERRSRRCKAHVSSLEGEWVGPAGSFEVHWCAGALGDIIGRMAWTEAPDSRSWSKRLREVDRGSSRPHAHVSSLQGERGGPPFCSGGGDTTATYDLSAMSVARVEWRNTVVGDSMCGARTAPGLRTAPDSSGQLRIAPDLRRARWRRTMRVPGHAVCMLWAGAATQGVASS